MFCLKKLWESHRWQSHLAVGQILQSECWSKNSLQGQNVFKHWSATLQFMSPTLVFGWHFSSLLRLVNFNRNPLWSPSMQCVHQVFKRCKALVRIALSHFSRKPHTIGGLENPKITNSHLHSLCFLIIWTVSFTSSLQLIRILVTFCSSKTVTFCLILILCEPPCIFSPYPL